MEIREKILIIEDEDRIANFMKAILTGAGYDVLISQTGLDGLSMLGSHRPDLVVLDLGLPDIDGVDIIARIREDSQTPIVVVSARSHEKDKVESLELGADDYITKPFGSDELVARVKVALRHSKRPMTTKGDKFTVGDLVIDYDKHIVYIRGENSHLTQTEYKIVSLLAQYAGKVLTYDFMIKELWGVCTSDDNQILRVNLAHIRRKIEQNPAQPEYIFTEVGVGYWMREE